METLKATKYNVLFLKIKVTAYRLNNINFKLSHNQKLKVYNRFSIKFYFNLIIVFLGFNNFQIILQKFQRNLE